MHDLLIKETLGTIAVIIGIGSTLPYIWLQIRKQIRPHAFSFLIWSVTGGSIFVAQVLEGGGAGAWLNAAFMLSTAIIFLLATFFHGERDIHIMDWGSLMVACAGLGIWMLTRDPLWSVLLMTAIDVVAFFPTYRKSYHKPHEEPWLLYVSSATAYMCSFFALQEYSLTTWFYPIAITCFNMVLVIMLIMRRRQVSA